MLDLRRHDGGFDTALFTRGLGRPPLPRLQSLRLADMHDLALTDEPRGELRRPALLARGTSKYQAVPAILDDRIGDPLAIRARYLRDGLKSQHAAPTEFAQARQSVLQAIDLPEGVELIHHEPQTLISFTAIHGFEDRNAHPRRNR